MPIKPRSTSRFSESIPILTRNGNPTYGIAKKYKFMDRDNLEDTEIKSFTVDADTAGRPDKIATIIYGDDRLRWIITMFNKVNNPLNWPLNNEVIEYPIPRVVSAEV